MDQNKRTEISQLLDLYGSLLTEKQRQIMNLYYDEDLSITEIAEDMGISRAAVHDAIKVAEKALTDYEKKLNLLKQKLMLEKALADFKKKFEEGEIKIGPSEIEDNIRKQLKLIEEIVEGL